MKEEFKGTRLTLEIGETKAVWETPYQDHSIDDLINALQGLCVSHTWIPESFVRSCGEWYNEMKEVYPDLKEDFEESEDEPRTVVG